MDTTTTIQVILTVLLSSVFGAFGLYILQRSRKDLKIAHNIAVIGFPKSGKTTLITSLFSEIMFNHILYINSTVRGEDTINRINEDIEKLKIGGKLGATTDQDVFAYRFDVTNMGLLFKKTMKVQIGDFPGEDSEYFYDNFGPWLHKTPFFKWVMQADSFIFVIDTARVLLDYDGKYKAQMIKSIIAAWQHIVEYHIESETRTRRKNVSIVFTKSDLLLIKNDEDINTDYVEHLNSLGFGDKSKDVLTILNTKDLKTDSIKLEFRELRNYFVSQNVFSSFVFASHYVYVTTEAGRLGMKQIINDNLRIDTHKPLLETLFG